MRPKPGFLVFASAGLQAGIVGVIWMFVLFVVAAFLTGGGIWSMPNLFATAFYGEYAWQNGFFRDTWSGIALLVVLYGSIGALWGCFWKDHRKPLLSFYGAILGLAVYYLFFNFVWTHVNPAIPLYAPIRQMQVAHVLWGAALSKVARLFRPNRALRNSARARSACNSSQSGSSGNCQRGTDSVKGLIAEQFRCEADCRVLRGTMFEDTFPITVAASHPHAPAGGLCDPVGGSGPAVDRSGLQRQGRCHDEMQASIGPDQQREVIRLPITIGLGNIENSSSRFREKRPPTDLSVNRGRLRGPLFSDAKAPYSCRSFPPPSYSRTK